MTTGKLIKKFRERAGFTQLDLAKKLGYEIPQFISLIENEHSKFPLAQSKKVFGALKLSKQEKVDFAYSLIEEYTVNVYESCGL